jgi:hypothetical protein
VAYWLRDTIPGAREVIEVDDARLFFPEDRPDSLTGPMLRFLGRAGEAVGKQRDDPYLRSLLVVSLAVLLPVDPGLIEPENAYDVVARVRPVYPIAVHGGNAGDAVRMAEAGPIVMNWRTGKVAEA